MSFSTFIRGLMLSVGFIVSLVYPAIYYFACQEVGVSFIDFLGSVFGIGSHADTFQKVVGSLDTSEQQMVGISAGVLIFIYFPASCWHHYLSWRKKHLQA
jgi:hypothetical protein